VGESAFSELLASQPTRSSELFCVKSL